MGPPFLEEEVGDDEVPEEPRAVKGTLDQFVGKGLALRKALARQRPFRLILGQGFPRTRAATGCQGTSVSLVTRRPTLLPFGPKSRSLEESRGRRPRISQIAVLPNLMHGVLD